MRRDELFHARIPPFSHLPAAESHYSPYVSPSVLSSLFFFVAFSHVQSSLNSPFLRSSFLVHTVVIYLGTTFASIPIQPGYSPATLFFLTFPCARPRRRRQRDSDEKMWCLLLFLPGSCARRSNAITENLRRKTQQPRITNDEFGNDTESFFLIYSF